MRHRPCGAKPFRRWPFGAQPPQRRHVGLDPGLVHEHQPVRIQPAPQRPPPCPLAGHRRAHLLKRVLRFFFEAQALAAQEPPDRVPAHRDAVARQLLLQPVEGQMRGAGHQRVHPLAMRLQQPRTMTADLARRDAAGRPVARRPLRH